MPVPVIADPLPIPDYEVSRSADHERFRTAMWHFRRELTSIRQRKTLHAPLTIGQEIALMTRKFRLYWRRETGCDAGTPVGLEDLDPVIRSRVGELAEKVPVNDGPIAVHLPFLDRREWRRRAESLRVLTLVREGPVIRHVPSNAAAALRDHAAEMIGAHPAWLAAPSERARSYFRVWRNVSVALQEYLRRAVPEVYFRDSARLENRKVAWPLLVYQAMRPCRGNRGRRNSPTMSRIRKC